MKIYLVGGAVRDKWLHFPVKEKDWVVVGASEQAMLQLGYRQVGKDFPVFLHPKTQEEYALARRERKIGPGYTGFSFDASEQVTLEEDLMRRDLTINAMAEDVDTGQLIDPYHGKEDCEKKLLRHVSDAFVEDPVRILRVARFAARYAEFTVAPETMALMQQMVQSGEVDALVAERVWKEMEKALTEKNPEKFFQVLSDCGALAVLFPQIKVNGAGVKALARAALDPCIRWAVLWHDVAIEEIQAMNQRYRIPSDYRELALLVSRYLDFYQRAATLTAEEILKCLQATDAFRREARFKQFLLAAEACSSTPQASLLFLKCYEAAKKVSMDSVDGLVGKEIGERINQERLNSITRILPLA